MTAMHRGDSAASVLRLDLAAVGSLPAEPRTAGCGLRRSCRSIGTVPAGGLGTTRHRAARAASLLA
jgi:hypothetical protein